MIASLALKSTMQECFSLVKSEIIHNPGWRNSPHQTAMLFCETTGNILNCFRYWRKSIFTLDTGPSSQVKNMLRETKCEKCDLSPRIRNIHEPASLNRVDPLAFSARTLLICGHLKDICSSAGADPGFSKMGGGFHHRPTEARKLHGNQNNSSRKGEGLAAPP